jgi:hypothetical protein
MSKNLRNIITKYDANAMETADRWGGAFKLTALARLTLLKTKNKNSYFRGSVVVLHTAEPTR